ncbi:Myb domain [Hexamita inflata]|uniref:Myb domain n=1 Tax=Hexamita inflata TaxID=28002 RepID=A0AA86TKI0_9EUKA|nr:Myb domain [Hexamita inflata]
MSKVLKHWTEEEQQVFFKCLEVYGNDFYSYTYHLNRSHSQIKSHYHNWLKQQQNTTNCILHKHSRGGRHIKFRSFLKQQSYALLTSTNQITVDDCGKFQ